MHIKMRNVEIVFWGTSELTLIRTHSIFGTRGRIRLTGQHRVNYCRVTVSKNPKGVKFDVNGSSKPKRVKLDMK